MPVLSDAFAHDAARHRARTVAMRRTVLFAVVAGLGMALAPLAPLLPPGTLGPALALGGGALVALAGWTLRVVARCHATLAAVELSPAGLVVTDAAGRRRALPWPSVRTVDLAGGGVDVVTQGPHGLWERLRFGPDWPQADLLARRVVRYAHAHRRPLCVDGVACDALSLAPLRAVLSAPGPGAGAT